MFVEWFFATKAGDDEAGENSPPESDFWYNDAGDGNDSMPAIALACERIISDALSSLPIDVRHETDNKLRTHYSNLLNATPNAYMSAQTYRKMVVKDLLRYGEHCTQVVRNTRNLPIALVPLSHESITKVVEHNKLVFKVSPVRTLDGTPRTLQRSDVLHIVSNTEDGINGIGILEDANNLKYIAGSMDTLVRNRFSNGAHISGLISVPGPLPPDTAKKMALLWKMTYSGQARAGKTAILGNGAKYEPVAMSSVEAQLAELVADTDYKITAVYGVPPHLVGLVGKTTTWGTGVEQQNSTFATYTLVPLAFLIERAIEIQLNTSGLNVFHDFGSVLAAHRLERYQSYAIGIEQGFLSVEEVKTLERKIGRGSE